MYGADIIFLVLAETAEVNNLNIYFDYSNHLLYLLH